MNSWTRLRERHELLSPSLVIDRGVLLRNLETMIQIGRGAGRLRPHVKTHKMPAIVRIFEKAGIEKHKCATIAEAEMVASANGRDVLIAYPLVGPNVARLAALVRKYPSTVFRAVVDDPDAARALSDGLSGIDRPLSVLVDLEVGMGRTGIEPGDRAVALYEQLDQLPNVTPAGLHAYDGHIHESDPVARAALAGRVSASTLALRDRLLAKGLPVPRLVMGGTPTFPIHATLETPGVELSPGTCTLHDVSYSTRYADLKFDIAAALLTRVVSRPRPGRICLDLGHKAVAADPVGPRVQLLDMPGATIGNQSEEHLVVDTPEADRFPPGTPLVAFPMHVCPTCALHRRVTVVEDGQVVDEWDVLARDRVLNF